MFKLLTISILCLFSISVSATSIEVGATKTYRSLRKAIQEAQTGDTLFVYPGHYTEGNIIVDKTLILIGLDYPVLDGQGLVEILTISAPRVQIHGFFLCNSGRMSTIDVAGIKVLAVDSVLIADNVVYHCNFGVYLSNAQHGTLLCNTILGTPEAEHNTGNGIHLWKCDDARIEGNAISGHRDGIYFEFVTNSVILDNYSQKNLRYGLHFMFSHSDRYTQNTFENNGAGVAVMYSHQVHMSGNRFLHNWGASAYGILLKDISDSDIQHNIFDHNTAGMYIEGASRMVVENNLFRQNGWALRVQASCNESVFTRNNFLGNSFDVATNGQTVFNTFNGNYWDRYEGYDLNRDGTGDVPFRPVSLYAVVVEQMPAGLILMRSFMVVLLDKAEKIMPTLTPEKLIDNEPAMKPVKW